jgi:hypothetical protein
LFQRGLRTPPEPRRLTPGPISVSERPSVSNRANLVRPGSVSRTPTFFSKFRALRGRTFCSRSRG